MPAVEIVLNILSCALLFTGAFFCLVGAIGILRLPEFFSRTHASGVTDTLGAGGILLGLMLQTSEPLVLAKLIIVIGLLWFTSPTAGYALARAALSHGLTPRVTREKFNEELREETLATGDKETTSSD